MLGNVNSKTCWPTGAPVAGRCWKAECPRAAVLLTHGLGEYLERYVQGYSGLIPALLARGFDVYGFDLQGHGQTPGPRAAADVKTLVQDHFQAREALRRQPLPVFAFGHSLGGLVTALSAARDPRGLSGVILSSPALLRGAAPLLAALAPTLPVTPLDSGAVSRLPGEVAAYRRDPQIYQGKVRAVTAATLLSASRAGWAQYSALTLPALVLHGTADRLAAIEGSRRFIATIASPDKTLYEVTGGYHELLNDLGRAETLRVLLDWLDVRVPGAE